MAKRTASKAVQKSPYRPNSKKRQTRSSGDSGRADTDAMKSPVPASRAASWILVLSFIIGIGGPAVVSIISMSGTTPMVDPPAMFAPWWVALIGLGVIVLGIINFRLMLNAQRTS